MTEFNTEELQLIKRVIGFATSPVPIEDNAGNKIFPTLATQKLANEILDRLEEDGVKNAPGLYTPFDPENDFKDKVALIWHEKDGYVHQVKGPVTAVLGSDEEGWSVAMGDTVLGPFERNELKASSQIFDIVS